MIGTILVHFLRGTNGSSEDESDSDTDIPFDNESDLVDVDIDNHPSASEVASTTVATPDPSLGVPSFNWGGQDNGWKLKGI